MADNFTDTAENLMLDWIFGVGTPTRPTTPLQVRLMTANGSDSAGGTEVTNSGGSTYAEQAVTFNTAASGATANSGAITFTNMPAVTVVGVEVWDDAGSPVRLAYGPLASSKVTNLGDTFTIATGDLDITLS